jgi:hypothetical protein
MLKQTICKFCVTLALFGIVSHSDAATEFFYTSSMQSWVGGGETVSITPELGFTFTPFRNADNGVSLTINDFGSNSNFNAHRWWSLDFAASLDVPLSVGTYNDATRWPFQGAYEPGLSFSGNGRGNNTLTGFFTVLGVEYGIGGEVLSFAADFTQYDEGFQSWWNVGSIRFNSNIPITSVPEPNALSLMVAGLVVIIVFIAWRRRTT